jgi:hypothetical protein
LRAVEDQSAPIPEEITSELGGTYSLKGRWSLDHVPEGKEGATRCPFVLAEPPR